MTRLVAGHLQIKSNRYYAVITFKKDGKTVSKWINTKLTVRGNKKKAEKFLLEKRIEYSEKLNLSKKEKFVQREDIMTLSELAVKWKKHKKKQVNATTYSGYLVILKNHIEPYFKKHDKYVKDVDSRYIQEYIDYAYNDAELSHKTVSNHRGVLSGMFKYAMVLKEIDKNPMDGIEPAIKTQPVENYYDVETLNKLLESVKGSQLEFPVNRAVIYGFRRSEVCGVKWSAVDFKNGILKINHTVTEAADEKGRVIRLERDETKNKRNKAYPLIDLIRSMMLNMREHQIKLGIYNDDGYVYIDDSGKPISPGYITETFRLHLRKNGFKTIRYHDLRHSCASALLSDKNRSVSLKDIQLWLGHSDIKSTMRYAHLVDLNSKNHTAKIVEDLLEKGS